MPNYNTLLYGVTTSKSCPNRFDSVDLIYLDPPFKSDAQYKRPVSDTEGTRHGANTRFR